MLRVRFVAAVVGMGSALAGCSSSSAPSWVPSWMTVAPPTQALQFESQPPGADVRAAQGQTCKTPCALALPLTNQTVTFAMNGYLPQTVPVEVHDSSAFAPNPVEVTLQSSTPPKPVKPLKPKPKTAERTMTAARTTAPHPTAAPPPQDNAFPPPPPMQSAPPKR
jgi:PEGA domain